MDKSPGVQALASVDDVPLGLQTTSDSSLGLFEKLVEAQVGNEGVNVEATPCDQPLVTGQSVSQDLDTVSLEDLLGASNWEWRVHGYNRLKEALVKVTSVGESEVLCVWNAPDTFTGWIADRNGNAQRLALELVARFLHKARETEVAATWSHAGFFQTFLEKCLAQPRLLSLCVDCMAEVLSILETERFLAPVWDAMDQHMDRKAGKPSLRGPVTKQMLGILSALEKLARLFGASRLSPKELIPRVSAYVQVNDTLVKQAAYSVLLEVNLWLGNLELVTCQLQEKQKSELQRRCEGAALTERLVPTRFFSREERQEKSFVSHGQGAVGGAGCSPPALASTSSLALGTGDSNMDLYSLLPEVELFKQIDPRKWEKDMSAAEKWKEKQELFESLIQECQICRRAKPTDVGTFVSVALRTIQTENNIVLVVSAFKLCSRLAVVLRQNFAPHARACGSASFTKLRDRSKPVATAVVALLEALLFCAPLETYIEDVARAIADKNSHCRQAALEFCIKAVNHPFQVEGSYFTSCGLRVASFALTAINDSCVDVRNAGAALLKCLLENPATESIARGCVEQLSPKKQQMVAEVLARVARTEAASTGNNRGAVSPVAAIAEGHMLISARRGETNINGNGKEMRGQSPRRIAADAVRGNKLVFGDLKVNGNAESKTLRPGKTSAEPVIRHQEADEKDIVMEPKLDGPAASEALKSKCLELQEWEFFESGFSDKSWKTRLETFERLCVVLRANATAVAPYMEALSVWLRGLGLRHFKETNVNVIKESLNVIAILPEVGGKMFTESCAVVFINGLGDKLGDSKLGPKLREIFIRFAEHLSAAFVVSSCLAVVEKSSNPKLYTESYAFLEELVTKVGAQACGIRRMVRFSEFLLEKKQATSRSVAMHLLTLLYRFIGRGMIPYLSPAVVSSSLDEIVSKATATGLLHVTNSASHNVPEVVQRGHVQSETTFDSRPSTASISSGEKEENTITLDAASFPLRDAITPAMLKGLVDSKWSTRKAALTRIQGAIAQQGSSKRGSSCGLMELFIRLRARVQHDSHRQVLREVLVCIASLGTVLGVPGIRAYGRCILPAVFLKFVDKTPEIREMCTKAVLAWLQQGCSAIWFGSLMSSQALMTHGDEREALTQLLSRASSVVIAELLQTEEGLQIQQALLTCLVDNCLQDRNHRVRSFTESFLVKCAEAGAPLSMFEKISCLKLEGPGSFRQMVLTKCMQLAAEARRVEVKGGRKSNGITLEPNHSSYETLSVAGAASTADVFSRGFVVKQGVSQSCWSLAQIEAYRRLRWGPVLTADDVAFLQVAWKPFVNESLFSAMFDKSQSHRVLKALTFWRAFCAEAQTLRSLCRPGPQLDQPPLIDLVIKWLTCRLLTDSGSVLSKIGEVICEIYDVLLMQARVSVTGEDLSEKEASVAQVVGEVIHKTLIYSALPQLIERMAVIGSPKLLQLREIFQHVIRSIVSECQPSQMTFFILMRSTGSPSRKVVSKALDELSYLLQLRGPNICHNFDRDVSKLLSLATSSQDIGIRGSALRALAALYPHMGQKLFDFCASHPDVREKLAVYLRRHPLTAIAEKARESSVTEMGADRTMENEDSSPSPPLIVVQVLDDLKDPKALETERQGADLDTDCYSGLRDFGKELRRLYNTFQVVDMLNDAREQIDGYRLALETSKPILFQQDLKEECRRVLEGHQSPNISYVAYWNGSQRLKQVQLAPFGESLVFLDALRLLHRPDPSAISEGCHKICVFFDGLKAEGCLSPRGAFEARGSERVGKSRETDWVTAFISELTAAIVFGLDFCFNAKRLSSNQQEAGQLLQAGDAITALAIRIVRHKNALQRLCLTQLSEIFRGMLVAMSSHGLWAASPASDAIANRLNAMVVRDLMTLVLPRNACHMMSMVIHFLLEETAQNQEQVNIPLALRTHRKIVNRLNAKHALGPLSDLEKQHYLRMLDVAILSLKRLDSDPVLGSVKGLKSIPNGVNFSDFVEDHANLPKLKGQLELLIKETIFIAIVVLGVHVTGVYFRDTSMCKTTAEARFLAEGRNPQLSTAQRLGGNDAQCTGFPSAKQASVVTQMLNHEFWERVEKLMNTSFSTDMTLTVCSSFAGQTAAKEESFETYEAYHAWFNKRESRTERLRSPPPVYPPFVLERFIATENSNTNASNKTPVSLVGLDPSLAAGWTTRRDTKAGKDVPYFKEFYAASRQILAEVEPFLVVKSNTPNCSPRRQAKEALASGLIQNELLGQYAKKLVGIASECGYSTDL